MKLYGVWELYNKKTPEKFYDYSEAYLDSAKRLCQVLIRSTNKASFVRGSVVQYLTFHSIELFLKGSIIAKSPTEKLSHDLDFYYKRYNKLYPAKKYRIDFPFRTNFEGLNPEQIEEARKQIPPQDQAHKYPTDKNGKEWSYLYAFEPISFLKIIEKLELDFNRIRDEIEMANKQIQPTRNTRG